MPPPNTKTLSPAELAKLEHAFATDPASEAYKPLAEAYLAMGRYMEAMVVCKKGVKAHPSVADPRVLLARVYADQGKDKKALEELTGALQVTPTDKDALRLMGTLQLRGGETDAGRVNLLKAYDADPKDADTQAAMAQFKVEAPKPVVVAPPPPPPAPVVVQSSAPVLAPVVVAPQVQPQASGVSMSNIDITVASHVSLQPVASAPQPQRAARAPQAPPQAPQPRPSAKPQARRPVVVEDEEAPSLENEVPEPARKKSGGARAMFFLLLFVAPVSAGAYWGIGQYKAKIAAEVKKQLKLAADSFKADTYASYKIACDQAEAALAHDPGSSTAHAYAAYGYVVRWGEHERNDEIRGRAEEHLKAAQGSGDTWAHTYAADALFKYYNGQGAQAKTELMALVKKLESESKRPSLLQLTLGIIQMNQGDLEGAKETLEKAQGNAPDDPRIFVALGNLNRRRGNDAAALNNFNSALRYTKNSHPDGLLGTALLILDQENPGLGYVTAATYLKTLLDSQPPPSPRQLAMGHAVKAYLISRVSADLPLYTDKELVKKIETGTGISSDPAKAKKDIADEETQAVGLDRNNPELSLVKGKRLSSEKKYDEAAAEIRKAIAGNGTFAQYYVELARVLMKKEGGEKLAEDALLEAIKLVPASPKLLSLLGQAQYRQKKTDDAKSTLEKAVADTATKNPEARYLLGRIMRDDKKDYDRAIQLFEVAAKEYYSEPTLAANTYDDLAQTYELKGDKDKAKLNYDKAKGADADFAPARCHFARLLSKSADAKEKDKAKDEAKESLRLDPQGECAADMKAISGG